MDYSPFGLPFHDDDADAVLAAAKVAAPAVPPAVAASSPWWWSLLTIGGPLAAGAGYGGACVTISQDWGGSATNIAETLTGLKDVTRLPPPPPPEQNPKYKPKVKPEPKPEPEKAKPKVGVDEEEPGRMRVQLQDSVDGKTKHTESVVILEQPPLGRGVTVRQVQAGLLKLYEKGEQAKWYPNNQLGDLGSAIIKVSEKLNNYPAAGGIQGPRTGIATEQWPNNKNKNTTYRVDVENLRGWNLRYLK
jgi:hypothetical protein